VVLRDELSHAGVELGARERHQRHDVPRIRRELAGEPAAEGDAAFDVGARGVKAQIALQKVLGQRGDRSRAGVRIDAEHHHPLGVIVPRGNPRLRQHERRGGRHAGNLAHFQHRAPPVVEAQPFAVGQHPHVGIRDQDLFPQIGLETVHHAQHHDQRHDSDGHPAHGDERNKGKEARGAAAGEVAQRDPAFQR